MKFLFLSFDGRVYFLFLCLCSFALSYWAQAFLLTDSIYYQSFGEQLSLQRFEALMEQSRKWQWIGYAITPLLYLFKLGLVALCLFTALLFAEYEVRFAQVFKVALIAEAIFLVPAFLRLLWFAEFQPSFSLEEVSQFMPLSMANLFDTATLEKWLIYPLQILNLFELLYIFFLAYGLRSILAKAFSEVLSVVLSGYGLGLLLWVALVIFLNISLL